MSKVVYTLTIKPKGGKESSYLTEELDDAIENFKANIRLGHDAKLEAEVHSTVTQ